MTQFFRIHSTHPQARLVSGVAKALHAGSVIAYPTDSSYALACHLGDKNALERIVRLRRLPKQHQFSLCCQDLSELGNYARVDNASYRLLRRLTPGPYTFVLKATREVPRRLLHVKRKTIGLRVPDHPVAQAILNAVGEPLLTTTLRLPDDESPHNDPDDIYERLQGQIDLIVDGGVANSGSSTVIDLTSGVPEVIRVGLGDVEDVGFE